MDKRWVKRGAIALLFLVGFNYIEHLAHQKTDGFSLHRITFSDAPQFSHSVAADPKITAILQQPFHYLDCGNQCFVFASEDGQYVLKFFKYANPPIPKFFTSIPLLNHFKPFRPHRFEKILWKQQRDLQSYQLAYNLFKEETGLIALHCDPLNEQFPTITLTDKLHIVHHLDLNTTPFVLQKRASPIYKQLRLWISSGQVEKAQLGVTNLLQLLKKRIAHQLQDDDVHFYSNFGFIGESAIQVDPGHFIAGTSLNQELEMKNLSQELVHWCEKHAPSLIPTISHETSPH